MASFETQPANALARSQVDKTGLKGLVIEFYDCTDCQAFWSEFVMREEVGFQLDLDVRGEMNGANGLGLDFGSPSPG